MNEEARFFAKVHKTDTCWLWTAGATPKGYGVFWNGSKLVYAHRWAWTHLVGAIPEGTELDHSCHVPPCVNPEHLEPVTHQVNMQRMLPRTLKITCKRGHLIPDNRICQPCRTIRQKERRKIK